tara:strand:- start:1584 stop:1787 length:204 start_codon:yes stop_codon:yes gene_type:complete
VWQGGGKGVAGPLRDACGKVLSMMFGILLFGFAVFGIAIAVLSHPAAYRAVTRRGSGSADHPDSKGL